jgi:hypothetical protein
MSRHARLSWHTRARLVIAGAGLAAAAPAFAQRADDLAALRRGLAMPARAGAAASALATRGEVDFPIQ